MATSCVIAVICAGVPASAWALVLMDWSVRDVAQRSDVIVIATVGARRQVDIAGQPFTETTLHVESSLRGALSELVVTQYGGQVGTRYRFIPGDPRFTRGERVLVFARQHRDGRHYIVGMPLGVYRWDGGRWRQDIEASIEGAPHTAQEPRFLSERELFDVVSGSSP